MIKDKTLIIIASCLLSLLAVAPVFGQNEDESTGSMGAEAFNLSAAVDIPLAAAGAGLFIADLFIDPVTGAQQPVDEIFFPDSYALFSFNSGFDITSDVLFAASLLLPLTAVIGQDFNTILETGVMFTESLLLTMATKDLIKELVPRYRPYSYDSIPAGDDDYMNSFPSGHTSMVFAVCSFSTYVFAEMFPDSQWKLPVGIGAFSIATATGVMRIVSGNHFITDVLAGALIGTIYGIGVPMLHQIRLNDDADLSVSAAFAESPAISLSVRI